MKNFVEKEICKFCTVLFVFHGKNGLIYQSGKGIIDNATLTALTLLTAESKPSEMETIKQVIISVLNRNEMK